MIGNFEFNGIDSASYNLVCKSVNRPILPVIRPRMMEIYGKSGTIDYGGGEYATRPITMHIGYIGTNYIDLRSRARSIAAWLSTRKWAKLIINDEPDKFYLARVINGIDFETLNRVGEADIVFECQPFAYMAIDTGSDPTWEESDFPWETDIPWNMVQAYQFTATSENEFTFYNPGTYEIGCNSPQGSKFDIIISGSWSTLLLTLNGNTLEYTESGSGELVIDNINMTAKLNGTNKLSALEGDIDSFLSIIPGENTITVSGSNLNITVTIDFRPMWL